MGMSSSWEVQVNLLNDLDDLLDIESVSCSLKGVILSSKFWP